MREFFRGWKRKVGVVTLMMACVAMVGWIRSRFVMDEYTFINQRGSMEIFQTEPNRMVWASLEYDVKPNYGPIAPFVSNRLPPNYEASAWIGYEWKYRFLGVGAGQVSYAQTSMGPLTTKVVFVSFWSVVLPLTALSAYLLLSMPRHTTPKKSREPIAEKVD